MHRFHDFLYNSYYFQSWLFILFQREFHDYDFLVLFDVSENIIAILNYVAEKSAGRQQWTVHHALVADGTVYTTDSMTTGGSQ